MLAARWSIRQLATLALAWAFALALAAVAVPATADVRAFDDPVGDSTFVDISRVRVIHRDSVIVRVRSAVPLAPGQLYAFWIDAGHGRGPDYYVDFRANAGFDDVLRRVRFFGIVGLCSFGARGCGPAPTSSPTGPCRSEYRGNA